MRANKYSAELRACRANHVHDSKKEARRCDQLHLLQRGGVIADLRVQVQYWFVINGVPVKYPNGRRAGIKVDFGYTEGGAEVAEDSKGMVVRDWPLRAAIFRALFPTIELRET